jgi:hypothetical protein
MGEDSDQAFLFRQAVFDHLITDQKCLHGRFWNVGHVAIPEISVRVARFSPDVETKRGLVGIPGLFMCLGYPRWS